MIEDRFADLIRHSYQLPIEEEQPQDTMLAAGPVTSDVPQTGVRLGRAGVTPQQSAQAGGLDKPLIALLDTLAGALRGGSAATLGIVGDARNILDQIYQEGAEAVMGKRMFPTTEEILQSKYNPPVIPAGAPNAAERQKTVDIAQSAGEFLPLPGVIDVSKAVTKTIKKGIKATKNMPVGMSTQMVGEGVSELGFYSAAKEAVDSIQQPKGTGEQFLKQIEKTPGVKPEEIKWTGLDDFLKSKKSVTKVEVQEFLDKNRVEVKEVQLGKADNETVANATAEDIREILNAGQVLDDDAENFIERYVAARSTGARNTQAESSLEEYLRNAGDLRTVDEIEEVSKEMASFTKFSQYTLPGGENYREILLTLPDQRPTVFTVQADSLTQEFKTIEEANNYKNQLLSEYPNAPVKILENKTLNPSAAGFKSQHFVQPNILAHLRVNDRVDADGKKVLFVEEVQSDWHQAGRKKGYASATKPYEVFNPKDGRPIATFATEKEAKAYADELGPQVDYAKSEGVPDAPFKTTWHELAMKRAIQLAAEGGYDRVAFTTGKTQAERYDLSKQIGRVTYKDEILRAYDSNGAEVISKLANPESLEEYVGKELASKIVADNEKLRVANKAYRDAIKNDVSDAELNKLSQEVGKYQMEYKGVDLQVGGEGMKGFYDQILPKFLDKYAKKWDAKVGMTKIAGDGSSRAFVAEDQFGVTNTAYSNMNPRQREELLKKVDDYMAVNVQYIDVTPKMKESVLTKGQPLFAIGAGGAAVQQEDNQ